MKPDLNVVWTTGLVYDISLLSFNQELAMTSQSTPSDAERLLDEACGWLAKLHSGDFSPTEQQRLAAWRAAAADHEHAWQKAQALWQGMQGLRGRSIPGSAPLLQERYRKPASHPAPRRFQERKLKWAAACCAALAVTLTAFYPPRLWQADYLTSKGEQRSITLADGSRVMLNSDSALKVHFDDAIRRIELLQGEAFFEVAKDANHPFVVTTAGREVRAVGTAFDVLRQAGRTRVELIEGIVDIQDAQHNRHQRLRAGQTAVISADTVDIQSNRQPENMALWRDGYLQFDGLPLNEAVAQLNRYRPGKVVLLNQALADKRISGLFRLDALDQAVASLKNAVPQLQIINITPYLVVLR